MHKYLLIILFSYLFVQGFEYWLKFINLRHMKKHGKEIPQVFEGYINESILKKIHSYTIEKTHFSFIKSIFGNAVVLIFFFGGILKAYNSWVSSFGLPFIGSGIVFFLFLSYAGTVLSIPFSLYDTFKIENKYGFNRTTARLWITDSVKSLLLSTVIIGIVVSVALWLIQSSPHYWWIGVWCFYLVFSLFIMYISPYVLEPLFNKFTPIEEEGLVQKIREIMQKVGIKVSRVFRMDASKRSGHTNAYFSGIGKVKRIILYDTLLEKMDQNEIIAVLSHEAGHWKKKHVLKLIIISEIASFIGIYVSFRILQTELLSNLFQIEPDTFLARVIILSFIGSIISFPLTPIGNYISRRFERQADRFAYELTEEKENISRALIKLSKDNLSNLYPHPLYAAFYYSHPPVIQRIESILKTESVS
jgi:STE24 endopeptidase